MRTMNPAPTTNAFPASLSCQNLATEDAVRLLKADPSFWAAIRPSWLVDSTWRPRIGAFAHWTPPDVGAEQVAVLVTSPAQRAEDDPRQRWYCVAKEAGGDAMVPADQLSPYPYVPWATIRRHAIPKLATAGIDVQEVSWDAVCDALHQADDPGPAQEPDGLPDMPDAPDNETDEASSAPRN